MAIRIIVVIPIVLMLSAARADPGPNLRSNVLGKSLICGEYKAIFDSSGNVRLYLDGKETDWSAKSKYVNFGRAEISIYPPHAQDVFSFDYKFGDYYIGDDKCVIK